MGKLTAVAVKAALANPGTYQDGDGLFLKVDKRGGAYWNLRLQQDGKRRDIGVGSAKLVTLAEFQTSTAKWFAQLDKNANGGITIDDFARKPAQ